MCCSANPILLDGAVVEGKIYVFVEPITDIQKVEFYIDGVLHSTESRAPYDLAGTADEDGRAIAFDTNKLSHTPHVFSARITKSNGSRETISADVDLYKVSQPGSTEVVGEWMSLIYNLVGWMPN
jgi:hypothetical protein